MNGLEGMDKNLIKQYSGAYGSFCAGDYQIGDTITGAGTSGEVIWSYRGKHGLTYVVDDATGWPAEILARLVQAR